ncbi:MAG: type IV pilin protein [Planctomycetota bacterium]|jgi:prepilin-type N-terminal cleavage/methylation domain-containing protein
MRREGFTLIELMIVVAIIAIIAAIAIPSLLTAKKSGHEAAIIASLRTLSSTEEQYNSRFGAYGSLADLLTEEYIDPVLGSGTKSGYSVTLTPGPDTWAATAVPTTPGTTGDRGFYVDQTGVLRFTADGTAPNNSSPALDH